MRAPSFPLAPIPRAVKIPRMLDWLAVGSLVAVVVAPLNASDGQNLVRNTVVSLILATLWAATLKAGKWWRLVAASCALAWANATFDFYFEATPIDHSALLFGFFGALYWLPVAVLTWVLFAVFELRFLRKMQEATHRAETEARLRAERGILYGVYAVLLAGLVYLFGRDVAGAGFLGALCVAGAAYAIGPAVLAHRRVTEQRAFVRAVRAGQIAGYSITSDEGEVLMHTSPGLQDAYRTSDPMHLIARVTENDLIDETMMPH